MRLQCEECGSVQGTAGAYQAPGDEGCRVNAPKRYLMLRKPSVNGMSVAVSCDTAEGESI